MISQNKFKWKYYIGISLMDEGWDWDALTMKIIIR